jgi:hypothetical protein
MMSTNQPKAPRKTPQRLSQRQEIALEIAKSIYASTATFDILDKTNGFYTKRVLHVSLEFADLLQESQA